MSSHRQVTLTMSSHRQVALTMSGHRQVTLTMSSHRQVTLTMSSHRQVALTLSGHRQVALFTARWRCSLIDSTDAKCQHTIIPHVVPTQSSSLTQFLLTTWLLPSTHTDTHTHRDLDWDIYTQTDRHTDITNTDKRINKQTQCLSQTPGFLGWVEQCLTCHQTHYRSYRGRVFTGQMTQPTVSKHWRKTQD